MPFSMVGSTGTVLQSTISLRAVQAHPCPARSKSGSPPRSRSAGSSGSYVCCRIASRNWSFSHANVRKLALCPHRTSMRNSLWSRLASGSPSPRPKAPILLAHPFLHTSVMTLVIAVMLFLQEIASYLLLQNDLVNHQFEATRSIPTKVN